VEITTTGSAVQADNIHFKAAVASLSANTLALDSYQSIRMEKRVTVSGAGGLSILTNDGGSGGTFSFGPKGRVSFANLSSPLMINGVAYRLVGTIATLASVIAANPSGNYAFARNYDASKDGTYTSTPVQTTLTGNVQGLGNAISNITMVITHLQNIAGLFLKIDFAGTVENVGLAALNIKMGKYIRAASQNAGGLVVFNDGLVFGDHVSGKISMNAKIGGAGSLAGGLVAYNAGTIANSYSTADISAPGGDPGGLVGQNQPGTITESFSTGKVSGAYVDGAIYIGGFAGANQGTIANSYSTGSAQGQGQSPNVGGFIGLNASSDTVSTSYSTGAVTDTGGFFGGFIGDDDAGVFSDCYWDTDTSGLDNGTGQGNVSGITGLTTSQFQSGLPSGFDPTVWAENPNINNGFPYLVANPPRQ
jgi:hypothetical protein